MKNKREIGITLVALVVTIIILLILAGITISQLTGNGLFENAKLAKEKYENAQDYEEIEIEKYSNEVEKYIGATRNGNVITKVLYTGGAGSSSFTLNDSIEKYDFIEFLVTCIESGSYGKNSCKFTPAELKSGISISSMVYGNSTFCTFQAKITVTNNTQVQLSNFIEAWKDTYGNSSSANAMYITSVIGYKIEN